MKKIIYLGLFIFLCSCTKNEFRISTSLLEETGPGNSTIVISFCPAIVEQIDPTKVNTEFDIHDVNIYLFNLQNNTAQNHYIAGNNSFTLDLVNGTYDIYVIGNWGRDLGPMSVRDLEKLKTSVASESQITSDNRMIMSNKQTVAINKNTTLQIPLNRVAVKVTFNISLSSEMAIDSKITYIRPYNCNNSVSLFADSRLSIGVGAAYSGIPISLPDAKKITKSYYFMENMQGKNNSIASQNGRNHANAPTYSTYLWIRVERNTKFIDYYVYLGGNITDDFNLCRNTNYNYNIVIEGENTNDLRVSQTNIYISKGSSEMGLSTFNQFLFIMPYEYGYCQLHIETINNLPDNVYTFSFYNVSGTFNPDWKMQYLIKGQIPETYKSIFEHQRLQAHVGNGSTVITFCFYNGRTSIFNHVFNFTIDDKNGYSKNLIVTTSKEWS